MSAHYQAELLNLSFTQELADINLLKSGEKDRARPGKVGIFTDYQ